MTSDATRVLLTGAHGFIGSHVRIAAARDDRIDLEVVPRSLLYDPDGWRDAAGRADVILHLAGLNRAADEQILAVNTELAERVRQAATGSDVHVVFVSSTRRTRDDAYGRSKRAAEEILLDGCRAGGYALSIFELSNVFGPGCRPHYNSVVATFASLLANGQQPQVEVDQELELLWVDDVARELLTRCLASPDRDPSHLRPTGDHITVSDLLDVMTEQWDRHRGQHVVPATASRLDANLYRTLVSYTNPGEHAYQPQLHTDPRGALFEVARQEWAGGQAFFSTTRPGVVRGQHYHTRKFEKFCVVQGEGVVRLRRLLDDEVVEYPVTGAEPTVVDIPVFFVHNLENVGSDDLLTIIWASEVFDPDDPDTIAEDV